MAEIHPDILAFWQDEPQKVGTAEELRQLEADLGTTLPDSFKEYQSEIGYKRIYFKNEKYKWGEMEAGINAMYDMGAQDVERPIVFSYFYSIEGIRNNQQDFASSMKLADIGARIPPGMLTVGSAMGKTQGQVLLNLSDENMGLFGIGSEPMKHGA